MNDTARTTQATLTIDLAALRANWRLLSQRVAPAQCAAVVKADAYGLGIETVVPALQQAGCTTFFVAHVSEGLRARAAAAAVDIYVLNGLLPGTEALYQAHHLRPILGSISDVTRWRDAGAPGPAALHVETGMNRLALNTADLTALGIRGLADLPISLLLSHFVSADDRDDPRNTTQIEAFDAIARGFPGTPRSLANSSGCFLPQAPFYDLVRPGYALYGGNPTPGQSNPMQPVVTLQAPILQVRQIEAGETVGYNAQWTARRRSRLAAIGVGYADGLPRNAMATHDHIGGEAIVAGRRCPFAGRVSMDLTVIDITDVPDAELGLDLTAELLGSTITIDELGARSKTIGYEILTNLGRRYTRRVVG